MFIVGECFDEQWHILGIISRTIPSLEKENLVYADCNSLTFFALRINLNRSCHSPECTLIRRSGCRLYLVFILVRKVFQRICLTTEA